MNIFQHLSQHGPLFHLIHFLRCWTCFAVELIGIVEQMLLPTIELAFLLKFCYIFSYYFLVEHLS